MSVSQDVTAFQEEIVGREVKASAAEKYGRWAERFEAWRPGGDPDEEMLRDFDTFLEDDARVDYPWENARGRPAPDSYAYSSRIGALSGVKQWADYHYGVSIDREVQNIALGEPADFDPTILDPAEVRRVQREASFACDNPDCEVAIGVGYDAIMRGAELADVRREDVDPAEGAVYVRAKKDSDSKHIELDPDTWAKLSAFVDAHPDREYLFRNAYGRAWTPAAWNQHFRRKHHDAGFHAYARHSPITNRLRAGEAFGSVYLRARHTYPRTTLKYVGIVGGVDAPAWATS